MLSFNNVALFCLGAALVIDTALLLVLAEGLNRRRIATALLMLVGGAWLFHLGVFGDLLFNEAAGDWVALPRKLCVVLIVIGGLIMPSAILHWLARLYFSGLDSTTKRQPKYLLAYLPLLATPVVLARHDIDFASGVVEQVIAPWAAVYALWVAAINLVAVVCLWALKKNEELLSARRLLGLMMATLLLGTVLNLFFTVAVGRLSPSAVQTIGLVAVMSPVIMSLLFGYFIVRFNFMQIVLGRSMLYGAILIAIFLIYHFFIWQISQSLSDRYQIDFSIVLGALVIALLLIIEPARRRTGEALRYLLGERMERLREDSRKVALQLSAKVGVSTAELLGWFCQEVGRVLDLPYVAVWQVEGGEIIARGGDDRRLDDSTVLALHGQMVEKDFSLSTRRFWQTALAEQTLLKADASMIVLLKHARISALLAFGSRAYSRSLSDEQVTAGQMLVEQLGITLANNLLQAERLAAERQVLERNRLSMLGLVTSSIAHEVKNPLSSIKTISTVLAEELGQDSRYSEELNLIVSEIDRLSQTVTQMLSFARPAQDASGTVSVDESLGGAVRLMRPLAKKRGIEIELERAPDLPQIIGDANGAREIFFNLLGNAIDAADKQNGGRGNVWVRAAAEAGAVVVSVRDDGAGIDADCAARIFEPFVTTKEQGTGLGLYVAKKRAEQLGAELGFEPAPDGGTIFVLRFSRAMKSGKASE